MKPGLEILLAMQGEAQNNVQINQYSDDGGDSDDSSGDSDYDLNDYDYDGDDTGVDEYPEAPSWQD